MSTLPESEKEEEISITNDTTTIKFGLFLMEQAVNEIESFDITQDLLLDLLRLNLAVVHLMNSLELLLKAILQGIGRDIYDSRGDTLNFYECLKSFSRNIIGSSSKEGKEPLPPSLLSAKNLYGIRNNIVHLGKITSKYTIIPLFRDSLQFFQDSIEIYFPSFEQITEEILKKTPRRIYTLDSNKVYDRYYARYLDSVSKGDFEIAIYSLFVAIESLFREFIYLKFGETQSNQTLLKIISYIGEKHPDLINNENQEKLYYFRKIRNNIVHGIDYEEEEVFAFLDKLGDIAEIYELVRAQIS